MRERGLEERGECERGGIGRERGVREITRSPVHECVYQTRYMYSCPTEKCRCYYGSLMMCSESIPQLLFYTFPPMNHSEPHRSVDDATTRS